MDFVLEKDRFCTKNDGFTGIDEGPGEGARTEGDLYRNDENDGFRTKK